MTIHDRFLSKVEQREADECWPWTAARAGGRDGKSYGYFGIGDGRMTYAHRVAFCLATGKAIGSLPKGIVIRHRCDNGLCCNPNHLIDGTQADNVRDMIDRGRLRRGEAITNAILKAEDIPVIRARLDHGHQHHLIAADYSVNRATISKIAIGKNWAWL